MLVRDETTREALRRELGPAGRSLLTLTAHECKGLEFQVLRGHDRTGERGARRGEVERL